MSSEKLSDTMMHCIEECERCSRACIETVIHCLGEGGKHSEVNHIRILLDCINICETNRDFMVRGSEFSKQICASCEDICEKCADDCEKFEDEKMKSCAEFCKSCAEACGKM
ncbi:MAG: four-helix bundle copper-binding protein [Nanoarchaeota archaeon]|nr:four-helix bundle copper-binding protein [Nanoarchaeota archaeon]